MLWGPAAALLSSALRENDCARLPRAGIAKEGLCGVREGAEPGFSELDEAQGRCKAMARAWGRTCLDPADAEEGDGSLTLDIDSLELICPSRFSMAPRALRSKLTASGARLSSAAAAPDVPRTTKVCLAGAVGRCRVRTAGSSRRGVCVRRCARCTLARAAAIAFCRARGAA